MMLLILCGSSAVLLAIAALALAAGVRKAAAAGANLNGPSEPVHISVIVAAHNEAHNIPALLATLRAQTYPHSHIHLIVANDRSTDETYTLCRDTALDGISTRIVNIQRVPDGVSPKKHALARAIETAETEMLLFTDADCIPEPQWVESMVRALHTHDVVIGTSPVLARQSSPAARYATYESRRTAVFMMGAAGLGMPYMAVGRNWAYRKSTYEKAGGLEPLFPILGGDDDLLLQRFSACGARIGTVLTPGSATTTTAPGTWKALFRQKRRHYSVSGKYSAGAMLFLGGIQILEWVCFVSAIVGILSLEILWKPIFILIPILPAAAWTRAYNSTARAESGIAAGAWEAVHLLFSTIAGLAGLVKSRTW